MDLPESYGGNLAHQSISGDTLEVEQHSIHQKEHHDVLVVLETPPTFPNHRHILSDGKRRNETETGQEVKRRAGRARSSI